MSAPEACFPCYTYSPFESSIADSHKPCRRFIRLKMPSSVTNFNDNALLPKCRIVNTLRVMQADSCELQRFMCLLARRYLHLWWISGSFSLRRTARGLSIALPVRVRVLSLPVILPSTGRLCRFGCRTGSRCGVLATSLRKDASSFCNERAGASLCRSFHRPILPRRCFHYLSVLQQKATAFLNPFPCFTRTMCVFCIHYSRMLLGTERRESSTQRTVPSVGVPAL